MSGQSPENPSAKSELEERVDIDLYDQLDWGHVPSHVPKDFEHMHKIAEELTRHFLDEAAKEHHESLASRILHSGTHDLELLEALSFGPTTQKAWSAARIARDEVVHQFDKPNSQFDLASLALSGSHKAAQDG